MKVTLRTRILVSFAAILVLMGLMGMITVSQLNAVNQLSHESYTHSMTGTKLVGDAIAEALRVRERLLMLHSATDAPEQQRQYEAMNEHAARLHALLEEYKPLTETKGAQSALTDFEKAWASYITAGEEVARLVRAGEREKASVSLTGSAAHKLNYAIELLLLMQDIEDNQSMAGHAKGMALYRDARNLALGMTIFAIVAGLALALWLSGVIAGGTPWLTPPRVSPRAIWTSRWKCGATTNWATWRPPSGG